MRWPWRRGRDEGTLVLGGMPERLLWLHSSAPLGSAGPVRAGGAIPYGGDAGDMARALRALRLPVQRAIAVLPLQQSQLLQIEAPAVPPEELRAAARWRVKELVEGRLDDLTIDVMHVGDGTARPSRQLFVAATRRALVSDLGRITGEAGLALTVVDIAEAAQRNLQTAFDEARGLGGRATALLALHGSRCLLTICADGELYYARRLDWDTQALVATPQPASAPGAALDLDSADYVDYGAEPGEQRFDDSAPRLVVELQRSFDLWERTWSELPLASVSIAMGDASEAVAAALERALGLHVETVNAETLFPGFRAVAGNDDLREAMKPMLGALLRNETRRL